MDEITKGVAGDDRFPAWSLLVREGAGVSLPDDYFTDK